MAAVFFVDATFGGGGHSKAILRKIPADSSLIALDCDEFAEEHAAGVGDKRFQFFRRNFSQLSEVLAEAGVQAVRGVLFDLGFFVFATGLRRARLFFSKDGGLGHEIRSPPRSYGLPMVTASR